MATAPSEQEILALAERALQHAGGETQVTASWELRLRAGRQTVADAGLSVEFVSLDRGVGRAATTDTDEPGLRRAAEQARRLAGDGAEPRLTELPDPAPGRRHEGWDPAVLRVDPAAVGRELGQRFGSVDCDWAAGAARTAVLSTRGVRAFEQRSFTRLRLTEPSRGRTVTATVAAVGPGALDLDAAAAELATVAARSEPGAPPAVDELPVVLGPAAVAVVLDLVRPQFGSLAAAGRSAVAERLGRRVMAPCINLSDSPRFPGTLPRSYDAEGVPRQPTPLVQDGVAHRVVRDSASPGGPSTGHATVAAQGAPAPLHLVLVGGGAADEDELMEPVEDGVYVPALSGDGRRALGAFAIAAGRRAAPLRDFEVELDGLAILAGAQALTMGQRLVAGDDASARTIGASMCPALRATGGLRVRGA